MLEKVISGGQVGVDIAALIAAKLCGIETGGRCPKNFKTKLGSQPVLEDFGVKPIESENYPPRTRCNVDNSDGTILIAHTWDSPGEILTHKFLKDLNKPFMHVQAMRYGGEINSPTPKIIGTWIKQNKIKILNIAGNADIAIELSVLKYLVKVFYYLKHHHENEGVSFSRGKAIAEKCNIPDSISEVVSQASIPLHAWAKNVPWQF